MGESPEEAAKKEYALLQYLMVNAGRVVSRTMIIEHVWDQSFGGGRNGGGNAPGGVTPFNALNGMFNTVLAPPAQDGIDMPPSKAEIDTWESGCRAYTATVNAWKAMVDESLFGFNSQLTKNNLPPLKIPATVSVPASCTFAAK